MGLQIVKQPDGKFAIWDTGSDYFVAQNLTENKAVDYMADDAADYARERARWNIEDIRAGKAKYDWEYCQELIATVHGDDDD